MRVYTVYNKSVLTLIPDCGRFVQVVQPQPGLDKSQHWISRPDRSKPNDPDPSQHLGVVC